MTQSTLSPYSITGKGTVSFSQFLDIFSMILSSIMYLHIDSSELLKSLRILSFWELPQAEARYKLKVYMTYFFA